VSGKKQYLIESLPGLLESPEFKQYAGYIKVSREQVGRLFFWLFESADSPDSDPLIIWMNGGPGASSMDGLFLEHGAFSIHEDPAGRALTLAKNPYSWNQFANLLYLDQPVGTGLSQASQSGYAKDDDDVNIGFYEFLKGFFSVFPELAKRPFYLAGESFAGHYLLSMASHILKQSRTKGDVPPLRGLLIGNGLFDPITQVLSAIDFTYAHGLISLSEKTKLKNKYSDLEGHDLVEENSIIWDPVLYDILQSTLYNNEYYVNPYDIRQYVNTDSLSRPHELIATYLARDDVKKATHTESRTDSWQGFSKDVYMNLRKCIGAPVVLLLPELLKEMRVLFYNGQYDIICNPIGTEEALKSLAWDGQEGFQEAARSIWAFEGRPAGFCKSHGNLSYVVVLNAGHMVPMDVPAQAQDMVRKFIRNEKLVP
jgi:carboxypeptidase D